MFIPKKVRVAILSYLFKEGILVVEKNFQPTSKHPEIDVVNLYIIKLMMSLKSRAYVREQFNWNHYYFFLTNEGIEFLRDELHLPAEVVPATLKRKPGQPTGERERPSGAGRGFRGPRKDAAGEDFKPKFEGAAGAGRAQPSTAATSDAAAQ